MGPKGGPGKPLEWETFFRMEIHRHEGSKIEAAVSEIKQDTKASRAKIFRDYKACKEFQELLAFLFKGEAADNEA